MAEYIKRIDAMGIVKRTCGDYAAAFAEIRKLPAADVVEVKHGAWLVNSAVYTNCDDPEEVFWAVCSECGRIEQIADKQAVNDIPYCHCGAKMDGET